MIKKWYAFVSGLFRGRGLSKYNALLTLDSSFQRMIGKKPEEVRYHNGHIIFDPCFSFQESFGPFEPFTSELVSSLLKPGGTFIDIGANIGWFTLLAARSTRGGNVYAFEPHPSAFATLVKNIEVNGYQNVRAFQSAVADYDGETTLFTKEKWDFASTTLRTEYGYTQEQSIRVPVTTLDSSLNKRERERETVLKIDLIKMDIEGGEMAALQGMKKLLADNPWVTVISEFSYFDSDEGYRYLNEWKKLGFSLYRINEKKRKLTPQTVDEIVHTPMAIRVHSTNILLKR